MNYIENPKTKGSGIMCAIPQRGECPVRCHDCFFQSGRSYLEPLKDNLPNVPNHLNCEPWHVIRFNDGHDSNVDRPEVVGCALENFDHFFFNTSIPKNLSEYPGPVVLTVNPAGITDKSFMKVT